MNNLKNYHILLKSLSKQYLNNEITYEEFKLASVYLTHKYSAIARTFKSELEYVNDDDQSNTLNFSPKGQLAH